MIQTYHFDLTQNLNECEQKKNEYAEKNLNLTTKIALFLNRNLYQIQSHKNLNFELGYLIFTKINFMKKSE